MHASRRSAAFVLLATAPLASLSAQVTSIVSTPTVELGLEGACEAPAISSDGRFVAFENAGNIYVRDRAAGTTERISVDPSGLEANAGSQRVDVSADGRFVVFDSLASNLVAGDVNGVRDVFVRDRATGLTEIASLDGLGNQSVFDSGSATISKDGTLVSFASTAPLVPGDTNNHSDIYLRDRIAGTTERISVATSGAQGNSYSAGGSAISTDGRFVLFTSGASNLTAGDTNGVADVYLRDRQLGTTRRISVGPAGEQANSISNHGDFSADVRFASFWSIANALVPGDTNPEADVYLHELATGAIERVSLSSAELQGNESSFTFRGGISADGRFVAFVSQATNLVAGDTNQRTDVFVRDRLLGRTHRENLTSSGAQTGADSFRVTMTPDGRLLAFDSFSDLLVSGDVDATTDVFLRDRGNDSGAPFCVGDGSGAVCPCGNQTPASGSSGCANSTGAGGRLEASGIASVGADTFTLAGSGMSSGFVLYFQGSAQENSGLGTVTGDGLRCAGGTMVRLATVGNVAGASTYPGAGDAALSVSGSVFPGATRSYQGWYRDPSAFCTGETYNFTSAWIVTWQP